MKKRNMILVGLVAGCIATLNSCATCIQNLGKEPRSVIGKTKQDFQSEYGKPVRQHNQKILTNINIKENKRSYETKTYQVYEANELWETYEQSTDMLPIESGLPVWFGISTWCGWNTEWVLVTEGVLMSLAAIDRTFELVDDDELAVEFEDGKVVDAFLLK